MAYSTVNSRNRTYYLHMKDVLLKGNRIQRIFYFAPDIREGVLDEIPEGYMQVENPRTGLIVLKKKVKAEKPLPAAA